MAEETQKGVQISMGTVTAHHHVIRNIDTQLLYGNNQCKVGWIVHPDGSHTQIRHYWKMPQFCLTNASENPIESSLEGTSHVPLPKLGGKPHRYESRTEP